MRCNREWSLNSSPPPYFRREERWRTEDDVNKEPVDVLELSLVEVNVAIGRYKLRNKASGSNEHVQWMSERSYFPSEWKCARIVLLTKAIGQTSSYHPLCLLSGIGIIFFRVLVGCPYKGSHDRYQSWTVH